MTENELNSAIRAERDELRQWLTDTTTERDTLKAEQQQCFESLNAASLPLLSTPFLSSAIKDLLAHYGSVVEQANGLAVQVKALEADRVFLYGIIHKQEGAIDGAIATMREISNQLTAFAQRKVDTGA
jgi:uncharacterized protein (DUF3084 family)